MKMKWFLFYFERNHKKDKILNVNNKWEYSPQAYKQLHSHTRTPHSITLTQRNIKLRQ